MVAPNNRTARVEARIAPEALRVVKRAAELQGRSLSDFIVESAIRQAKEILQLSLADQSALAEAILNPPPLAAAMDRAIARYQTLITKSQ
jgi:uncharacterized protein (DUF1778 family)